MQRVRIGLTGLGFVFLLVLLAAVFSRASDEEAITANAIEQNMVNGVVEKEAAPKEPLAELGVTPGNAETNQATAAPADEPVQAEQ